MHGEFILIEPCGKAAHNKGNVCITYGNLLRKMWVRLHSPSERNIFYTLHAAMSDVAVHGLGKGGLPMAVSSYLIALHTR